MEDVFCTEHRKTPLKIGSVKSNIGHCESAGLLMSIIKTVIAFECGYIPPNINYTEPNENVTGLKNGKIQVWKYLKLLFLVCLLKPIFYVIFYV